MQNKEISIIIVNWNGLKWLDKCISSLQNQTYKNIEIILVDNASTDGSTNFVEEHFPKVKVIRSTKNLGFSNGNNIGISKAKGEYILLINNDTWVENDFLNKLVDFYENNNFDIIAPRERRYDKKENFNDYNTTIDIFGHPVYLHEEKGIQKQSLYLTGVCLLFSKKMYLETGSFDNNFFMYCEEVDWFWRLNLLGKKYSYADDIFVYHEGAGSTGSGIKYTTFLWRNQNTLQMLLKNYALYNLALILPIYLLLNVIEFIFFILIIKPKIAFSYIEGLLFNIQKLNIILRNRKWVQKNRKIKDSEILNKMYLGSGKLKHLISSI